MPADSMAELLATTAEQTRKAAGDAVTDSDAAALAYAAGVLATAAAAWPIVREPAPRPPVMRGSHMPTVPPTDLRADAG